MANRDKMLFCEATGSIKFQESLQESTKKCPNCFKVGPLSLVYGRQNAISIDNPQCCCALTISSDCDFRITDMTSAQSAHFNTNSLSLNLMIFGDVKNIPLGWEGFSLSGSSELVQAVLEFLQKHDVVQISSEIVSICKKFSIEGLSQPTLNYAESIENFKAMGIPKAIIFEATDGIVLFTIDTDSTSRAVLLALFEHVEFKRLLTPQSTTPIGQIYIRNHGIKYSMSGSGMLLYEESSNEFYDSDEFYDGEELHDGDEKLHEEEA